MTHRPRGRSGQQQNNKAPEDFETWLYKLHGATSRARSTPRRAPDPSQLSDAGASGVRVHGVGSADSISSLSETCCCPWGAELIRSGEKSPRGIRESSSPGRRGTTLRR